MKYIYVGKIVNTHGIKGEVRILSDFKYKDKVFVKGFNIYIGKNKDNKIINSYRYHKIFDMITMVGINNIQDVLVYKGRDVFVNRDDLVLDDGEYLDDDLIGLDVVVNDQVVGRVTKYIKDRFQDKIVVNKNEKEYLIPNVSDIILDVNLKDGNIVVDYIKGLLD